MRPSEPQPIVSSRLMTFGGLGLPLSGMGLPMIVFLPPYFVGVLGLELALVGLIFGLVRLVDTAFDPVVGVLVDRTRSRYGRFKPWIAIGALICAVAVTMTFFAQPGVEIAVLIGGLLLLYTGNSFMNVAQAGWGAALGGSYAERARIFTFHQGGHMVGLILVLSAPAIFSLILGNSSPSAVHIMGAFILASLPIAAIAALALVPRPSRLSTSDGDGDVERLKLGWRPFFHLASHPSLRTLLAADLLVHMSIGSTGTLFRFFFEQARGYNEMFSSLSLLFYFVGGLLALPLWLTLSVKIGKGRAAGAAAIFGAVSHVIASLIFAADNPISSIVAIGIAGTAYAAPIVLLRAMLADHIDEVRAAGSGDHSGLMNAVLTTAQKVGTALPVAILFPLLGMFAFTADAGAVNSDRALMALEASWFIAVPAMLLPAAWVLFTYTADRELFQRSGNRL